MPLDRADRDHQSLSNLLIGSLAKGPSKRFPSASAMTAAIAEAFNLPMPPGLSRPASPINPQTSATDPEQPSLLLEAWADSTSSGGQSGITLPDVSHTLSAREPVQNRPTKISHSARPHLLRGRVPRTVSMIMLILLLAGSALAWLFHSRNLSVGHFSFLSSGLFNGNDDRGINDMIQIDLQGLPDPDPGKSYYLWLLVNSNQVESGSLPLEQVTLTQHAAHVLYADPQHSNLLASYGALLLTEEETNPAPTVPSPDRRNWRYLAQIPQTPDPTSAKHYSLLDHLRHLLAADPDIQHVGLPGGLDTWLNRNAQELSNLAGRAGDDWHNEQVNDLRRQVVCILYYLDGNAFIWQDLPLNTPLSIDAADRHDASIGLIGRQNEEPSGYLAHISLHLNGLTQAPGATPEMSQRAGQVDRSLNQVRQWLERVRQDALLLIRMNNTQLLSQESQPTLNNFETQAEYAYYGQSNQASNELQEGVSQIYSDIQRLTTFDIIQYTSL